MSLGGSVDDTRTVVHEYHDTLKELEENFTVTRQQVLYSVFYKLNRLFAGVALHSALFLIEGLQFLSLCFVSPDDFHNGVAIGRWGSGFDDFLDAMAWLRRLPPDVPGFWSPLFLGLAWLYITIVCILFMYACVRVLNGKIHNKIPLYLLHNLGLGLPILYTPMLQLCFYFWNCRDTKEGECGQSPIHTLYVLLAVSVASMLVPAMTLHSLMFYTGYPVGTNVVGRLPSRIELVFACLKLLLVFLGEVFVSMPGLRPAVATMASLGLVFAHVFYMPFYRVFTNYIRASLFMVCALAGAGSLIMLHGRAHEPAVLFYAAVVPAALLGAALVKLRVWLIRRWHVDTVEDSRFYFQCDVSLAVRLLLNHPEVSALLDDRAVVFRDTRKGGIFNVSPECQELFFKASEIYHAGMMQYKARTGTTLMLAYTNFLLYQSGNFQLAQKYMKEMTSVRFYQRFELHSQRSDLRLAQVADKGNEDEVKYHLRFALRRASKAEDGIKHFWGLLLEDQVNLDGLSSTVEEIIHCKRLAKRSFKLLIERYPLVSSVHHAYAIYLDKVERAYREATVEFTRAEELDAETAFRATIARKTEERLTGYPRLQNRRVSFVREHFEQQARAARLAASAEDRADPPPPAMDSPPLLTRASLSPFQTSLDMPLLEDEDAAGRPPPDTASNKPVVDGNVLSFHQMTAEERDKHLFYTKNIAKSRSRELRKFDRWTKFFTVVVVVTLSVAFAIMTASSVAFSSKMTAVQEAGTVRALCQSAWGYARVMEFFANQGLSGSEARFPVLYSAPALLLADMQELARLASHIFFQLSARAEVQAMWVEPSVPLVVFSRNLSSPGENYANLWDATTLFTAAAVRVAHLDVNASVMDAGNTSAPFRKIHSFPESSPDYLMLLRNGPSIMSEAYGALINTVRRAGDRFETVLASTVRTMLALAAVSLTISIFVIFLPAFQSIRTERDRYTALFLTIPKETVARIYGSLAQNNMTTAGSLKFKTSGDSESMRMGTSITSMTTSLQMATPLLGTVSPPPRRRSPRPSDSSAVDNSMDLETGDPSSPTGRRSSLPGVIRPIPQRAAASPDMSTVEELQEESDGNFEQDGETPPISEDSVDADGNMSRAVYSDAGMRGIRRFETEVRRYSICTVAVVLFIALLCVIMLAVNAALSDTLKSFPAEVGASTRAMFLVKRTFFFSADLMADSTRLGSRADLRGAIMRDAAEIENLIFGLNYGDKSLGLPGAQKRDGKLDRIMFEPVCSEDALDFTCYSLHSLSGYYLDLLSRLVTASEDGQINGLLSAAFVPVRGAQPVLVAWLADYTQALRDDAASGQSFADFVTALLFVFSLVIVVFCYLAVFFPITRALTTENRQSVEMLLMLPLDVAENTPEISEFLATGKQSKESKAVDKLKEVEERTKSILETANDGIVLVDDAGTVQVFNRAAQKIFGLRAHEIMGRPVGVLIAAEGDWMAADRVGTTQEVSVTTKRGKVPITLSLSKGSAKGKTFHVLLITDITLRRARETELHLERERSEALLLNVLPRSIVERLKGNENFIAETYESVTILFMDIVGFTTYCGKHSAEEVVGVLNEIFSMFDARAEEYGLEKIKTIGDNYMICSGLPERCDDHAPRMCRFALDIKKDMEEWNRAYTEQTLEQGLQLRIGINTGPVVAGVIGVKKFCFDLWGDAVNVASRMESTSIADRIQVSPTTFVGARDTGAFNFQLRGEIDVKGKGKLTTYFLRGWAGDARTSESYSGWEDSSALDAGSEVRVSGGHSGQNSPVADAALPEGALSAPPAPPPSSRGRKWAPGFFGGRRDRSGSSASGKASTTGKGAATGKRSMFPRRPKLATLVGGGSSDPADPHGSTPPEGAKSMPEQYSGLNPQYKSFFTPPSEDYTQKAESPDPMPFPHFDRELVRTASEKDVFGPFLTRRASVAGSPGGRARASSIQSPSWVANQPSPEEPMSPMEQALPPPPPPIRVPPPAIRPPPSLPPAPEADKRPDDASLDSAGQQGPLHDRLISTDIFTDVYSSDVNIDLDMIPTSTEYLTHSSSDEGPDELTSSDRRISIVSSSDT